MTILLALLLLASDAPTLKVATYAYPKYDRAAALAPLGHILGAELGRPVEIVLYGSPDELRDAAAAGKVDIAMTNLGAFAGMAANPRLRSVAALDVPDATLQRYRGVLLARRDTGVLRVVDLPTRAPLLRYSEVLPGSTSGGLVQAGFLRRVGIERKTFASIRYAGTHEAALDDVVDGRADMAAMAEEAWHRIRADRPDIAASLIELWRSEPLPPGPVVCVESRSTPCARVGAALLREGASDAARALASGWSETVGATRFEAVDPAAYRSFIEDPRR